jgi:hypothetical protein
MLFVSRTLATLRMAEFGFLGVVVNTRVHTPRFCGHFSSAGDLLLSFLAARPFLTSWFTVGNKLLLVFSKYLFQKIGQNS